MPDLLYNFLNDIFTVYLPIETPEIRKINYDFADVDLPDDLFASSDGVILANNNLTTEEGPRFVVDNTEEYVPEPKVELPVTSLEQTIVQEKPVNTSSNRIMLAKQFFIDKGLTDYQAAGIVGNLRWESGDHTLLTTDTIGDNGKSFGIALWNKNAGRWLALKRFALSRNKDASDFNTLLEFIWKELQDNPRWLKALKRTKNFAEATNSFMINFENPDRSKANLRLRTIYAEEVWKQN